MVKQRDEKIDLLRGFATLLVVLGHVLRQFSYERSGFILNFTKSFNMPIFMLIAGYVTVYSKTSRMTGVCDYKNHLLKRLKGLLLPWISWSILFYLFINRGPIVPYIKQTSMHMESAYWFFFSLWTIDLIFSTARFLCSVCTSKVKNKIIEPFVFAIFFGAGMGLLLVLGLKMGLSFLAIKYSLFYSLFFIFGIVISMFKNSIYWDKSIKIRNVVLLPLLVFYFIMLTLYDIEGMPDTVNNIIIRLSISVAACYIAIEVVDRANLKDNLLTRVFRKVGNVSLEFYVIHLLIVRIFNASDFNASRVDGMLYAIVYFAVVSILTAAIIWVINKNSFAKLILFGRSE